VELEFYSGFILYVNISARCEGTSAFSVSPWQVGYSTDSETPSFDDEYPDGDKYRHDLRHVVRFTCSTAVETV
jgi:hypothetical protein